jgi:D-aspartate ligase
MNHKTGVIVTGGDFQGLALLRTFARKGIPTILLDHELSISMFSRYRGRFRRSPNPANENEYVDYLLAIAYRENLNGWCIFPNSDEIVWLLSRNRDALVRHYRIPTPGWNVIGKLLVKKEAYAAAESNGIPIPRIYWHRNLEDLLEQPLSFPLVIKPSVRHHFYGKVRRKAYLIKNTKELIDRYTMVSAIIDTSEIIVQDFIPGGPQNLYSFCPFFKDGNVVAGITARRSRQHPMDFGHASTFVELVNCPDLEVIAAKFLKLVGYYGIAEVEFMHDPRDRIYKLLEVNPRFWGWHSLAIAAGVDLPYMVYQDLLGEQVTASSPSSCLKWIRMITDFPTVCTELLKGNMTVGEYVKSLKGRKTMAVFAVDDPLPAIVEILLVPYLWVRRGF